MTLNLFFKRHLYLQILIHCNFIIQFRDFLISVRISCFIYRLKTWQQKKQPDLKKGKDLNGHLTKDDIKIANKHINRCFTAHIIREKQIKNNQILLYIYWNGQNIDHWHHQMLVRKWSNGNAHSLLAEYKMITATLEDSLVVSKKLNILLPYNPATVLLGIYPEELKTYIYTKICKVGVYSSFIHNCQNLKATKMSFIRWMDKLVHPDNGILFSTQKEMNYQARNRHQGTLNAYY